MFTEDRCTTLKSMKSLSDKQAGRSKHLNKNRLIVVCSVLLKHSKDKYFSKKVSIQIGNNEAKPTIIHINNVNPAGDYEQTLKCIWPNM